MTEDPTFGRLCEIRQSATEFLHSNPSYNHPSQTRGAYIKAQSLLKNFKTPDEYRLGLSKEVANKDPDEKNMYTSVASAVIIGFAFPRLRSAILDSYHDDDHIGTAAYFDTYLGVKLAMAEADHISRSFASGYDITNQIIREVDTLMRYLTFARQNDGQATAEAVDRMLRSLSGGKTTILTPDDIKLIKAKTLGYTKLLVSDRTGLQMIDKVASETACSTDPRYRKNEGFPGEIVQCKRLGIHFTAFSYRHVIAEMQRIEQKQMQPPRASILERLHLRVPKMA